MKGYASANYFYKRIQGFTTSVGDVNVNDLLTQMGISYIYLAPSQRDAIDQRGGPDRASVGVNRQYNNDAKLNLQGLELLWVQPLPMVLEGLGYSISATHVDQEPDVQARRHSPPKFRKIPPMSPHSMRTKW